MKLLLDTHIWIWANTAPEKLSKRVKKALTSAENELWLSPVSVWEFLMLVEKGRIEVAEEPRDWVERAWSAAPLHEATLNREVAMHSRGDIVQHGDPADRFIAATALVYDLTLITADEALGKGKGFRVMANR